MTEILAERILIGQNRAETPKLHQTQGIYEDYTTKQRSNSNPQNPVRYSTMQDMGDWPDCILLARAELHLGSRPRRENGGYMGST